MQSVCSLVSNSLVPILLGIQPPKSVAVGGSGEQPNYSVRRQMGSGMEKEWGNGLCHPGWEIHGKFPPTAIFLAHCLGTKLFLACLSCQGPRRKEIHYSHFNPGRSGGKKKEKKKTAIGWRFDSGKCNFPARSPVGMKVYLYWWWSS